MIELYQLPSIRTSPQIIAALDGTADDIKKKAVVPERRASAMREMIIWVLSDGIPRTKYQIADLLPEYPSKSVLSAVRKMSGVSGKLRSFGCTPGQYSKKLYAINEVREK